MKVVEYFQKGNYIWLLGKPPQRQIFEAVYVFLLYSYTVCFENFMKKQYMIW